MALTTGQINFVSRAQEFARLLQDQYGEIASINALWFGAEADYNDQITTEELQAVEAFAHLTVEQLNEVLYIAGQLKALIDPRIEPIAVVSQ